jgi:hypothetical protein
MQHFSNGWPRFASKPPFHLATTSDLQDTNCLDHQIPRLLTLGNSGFELCLLKQYSIHSADGFSFLTWMASPS